MCFRGREEFFVLVTAAKGKKAVAYVGDELGVSIALENVLVSSRILLADPSSFLFCIFT